MASSTTRSTGTGTTTSSTSTTTGRTMPITTSVRRLVVSRYVFPCGRINSLPRRRVYAYLTDFSQPPSILPTSKACSVSFRYFLLSKILISLASRNRSFNTPSLLLTFSKTGSFHSRLAVSASIKSSRMSKITVLVFSPKAYLSLLGKALVYS